MASLDLPARPRRAPYIWVTWLARYIAGPECPWAYWFRANHTLVSKQPDHPDAPMWNARHEAIVVAVDEELRDAGLTTERELDLKLAFAGGALLAGKADIVATDVANGTIEIFEAKGGWPQASDANQLLAYMLMMDQTIDEAESWTIGGWLVRQDSRERFAGVPEEFEEAVVAGVARLASSEPPPRVPGHDCRFCPLTTVDCPDRIG